MSNGLGLRIGGAFGAAYVLLTLVGGAVGGGMNSPDLTASRATIAAWVAKQHNSAAGYAGGLMELLGLLAFVVFAAALYRVLRRGDQGGILATTALGAALVSAALKLGSVPLTFALEWRARQGFDPQLAAAILDADNVAFILTWALDAVWLAAAAFATLRMRVLPRWLGILAAVTAPVLLLSTAAANHVPPLGMLLTLVWIAATGLVVLLRREPVPEAVAVTA